MTPEPEYRLIPLTQGQFAKVSPHRFEELSRHKWRAFWNPHNRSFYAVRKLPRGKDKPREQAWMHREILGLNPGDKRQGDHENHDTLDNTDGNLRIATNSQNSINCRMRITNHSGFKGISKKSTNKWVAQIRVDGKKKYLGTRSSPEAAHRELYVPAALKYYGEFACLE